MDGRCPLANGIVPGEPDSQPWAPAEDSCLDHGDSLGHPCRTEAADGPVSNQRTGLPCVIGQQSSSQTTSSSRAGQAKRSDASSSMSATSTRCFDCRLVSSMPRAKANVLFFDRRPASERPSGRPPRRSRADLDTPARTGARNRGSPASGRVAVEQAWDPSAVVLPRLSAGSTGPAGVLDRHGA